MSNDDFYSAAYDAAEADCKALRAENNLLRKELDDLKLTFEDKTDSNVRRVWKRMCNMALHQRDEAKAEINRLRGALEEAREDVAYWGNYASDYSKEKHDLDSDLARIDATLAEEVGQLHSAWPTGPGYKKGDTCQSADGTIWHCVEDGITAKWERGNE